MGVAKIWHYRDHDHGGRFDGNCYVDTGSNWGATVAPLVPVKCRFRIDAFPANTKREALWGSGYGDGEYALYALPATDNTYSLRVSHLGSEYIFDAYPLYFGQVYDVRVYRTNSPALCLDVYDRWGNLLYRHEADYIAPVGTLTVVSILIGATSDESGKPYFPFVGTIFDFYYFNSTDYHNLSFMKNLGGVGDSVVKDWFDHQNGSLSGTVPSDFWPIPRDLSHQVISIREMRRESDSYRIPEYASCTLEVIDADDLRVGDILTVEDTSGGSVVGVFQIAEIGEEPFGVRQITAYDALKDLEQVMTKVYVSAGPSTVYSRQDWWCHLSPQTYTGQTGGNYPDVEYYYDSSDGEHRWYSVPYLLRLTVYYLQLERLLTPDTSNLIDAVSGYTDGGYGVPYRWFAINPHCLMQAGRSNYADPCTTYMSTVFREILNVLRITYLVENGSLAFLPVTHETVAFADHLIFDRKQATVSQHQYHQVEQTQLASKHYWGDAWTEEDATDVSVNNLVSDFKFTDNVIDLMLTAHLLIRRHSHNNNQWLELDPPLLDQVVDRLDAEFTGDFDQCTVKTALTLTHDPRFLNKSDNLVEQESEIKYEL